MKTRYFYRETLGVVLGGICLSLFVHVVSQPTMSTVERAASWEDAVSTQEALKKSKTSQRLREVLAHDRLANSSGYQSLLVLVALVTGAGIYSTGLLQAFDRATRIPDSAIRCFEEKYQFIYQLARKVSANLRSIEDELLPTMLTNGPEQVAVLGELRRIASLIDDRLADAEELYHRGEVLLATEILDEPLAERGDCVSTVVTRANRKDCALKIGEVEPTVLALTRRFVRLKQQAA